MSRRFRFKYVVGIVTDDINNRRLEAVLFSSGLSHVDVGVNQFGSKRYMVGAGFVGLDGTMVFLSGESETLGIGISKFDQYYVERALGLHPSAEWDLTHEVREKLKEDYKEALEFLRTREKK